MELYFASSKSTAFSLQLTGFGRNARIEVNDN